MIPRIIHYCWFGNNKKPWKIRKCINTWKKKLPNYEFMEWNEKNFNIYYNKYTKEAYESKKYAFVSDVARLVALYNYGGIYLDTDVLVYKNFDEILDKECVFGFEECEYVATSFLACKPKMEFIKEFLENYEYELYGNNKTNVVILTELLEKLGLERDGSYQIIDNMEIYPKEYFSPYDYINCVMSKTSNTICAHLFFVSWSNKGEKIKKILKKIFVKLFGKKKIQNLRKKYFIKEISDE